MKSLPLPNINAKPTTQKASDDAAKTMKFLARMLTAFFARQRPLSTSANPAFMKNTRNAVTSTHRVSSATLVSGSMAAWATPGVASTSKQSEKIVSRRLTAPPRKG